jgi:hypothetical protein
MVIGITLFFFRPSKGAKLILLLKRVRNFILNESMKRNKSFPFHNGNSKRIPSPVRGTLPD